MYYSLDAGILTKILVQWYDLGDIYSSADSEYSSMNRTVITMRLYGSSSKVADSLRRTGEPIR
jgi:hypothetical protein